MPTQDIILSQIDRHYPSLEYAFSRAFPDLSFNLVIEQLEWSINETETMRGLHRLHCYLQLLNQENPSPLLSPIATIDKEELKEALLVLLLIDSCKLHPDAITEFSKEKNIILQKDSVIFFFESLSSAPEIYSSFRAVSPQAQAYLRENIFYLHERHLLFGEIPINSSTLADLLNIANQPDKKLAKEKFQFLHLFWTINMMGFVPPKCAPDQKAETVGPTTTEAELVQLHTLQTVLDQCIDTGNLKPIYAYYGNFYANFGQYPLHESSFQVYIGRLCLLLLSKNDKNKDDVSKIIDSLLSDEQQTMMLKETITIEEDCYKKFNLISITFVPAIYWKLKEIHSQKPEIDIIKLFIQFQKAFYTALLKLPLFELQGSKSLPLFSITQTNNTFLNDFSNNPDYGISLTIDCGKFITVTPRLLAPSQTQLYYYSNWAERRDKRTEPTSPAESIKLH